MFFIKNNVIYTMMLVIQGENDKYATLAQVDAIARRAGAGAEVMVLPDCGHSPHTEQKATTLKVMADFILSILHQLVYVVIKQTKKGYMMLVKEILNSTRSLSDNHLLQKANS
ncbi:MAG: alpha/beta hydrolase [Desulfobacterales bacterium]|uniref:Alpha/beta hydrolase n=1 Tax=Candidatus Desulfaltia bathyphila TaxID=2841697 RepID=A0A8J6T6E0_9BACT|nr:alpha/beta hydrolase [Candidatus Desulfaltia bathyphila]MBL7194821.1 alpha/beta hydrolase [Desulfobacterales bacterium]MBL7206947.1 alpha/beta hydrolase [Desulfobacterales bacterium]